MRSLAIDLVVVYANVLVVVVGCVGRWLSAPVDGYLQLRVGSLRHRSGGNIRHILGLR